MAIGSAARLVRQFQIAMLVSIALYAVAGEMLAGKLAHDPANALFHALSFISISIVGATVVIRRTLVLPSEGLLKERSDDSMAVARWRTGYLFLYALCELLGVFGLILRMSSFALGNVWGFYLGGLVLLLLYSPRAPRSEFG
jgi:hypothetical protein